MPYSSGQFQQQGDCDKKLAGVVYMANVITKFQARDATIQDVLFGNMKFRIPRYQRPYAWEEDQISEFWGDLIGNSQPFFIGSLILNYETLEETGYIEIIDGQQRLLTITMLAAVLRDIAQDIDHATAERYQRQDIAIEDRDGRQDFRILPGDSTMKFFRKYIQQPGNDIFQAQPATKEELRIQKNYQFLYNKIKNNIERFNTKKEKIEYLSDIRKRVSNLIVIHIQIDNEEDAYEIFETTNARGVDLSVSDLIKNLIFKNIPAKNDRDFAKDVWQEITDNIEATGTELKKFIRYFWISRYAHVTEKKLFRAVKEKIKDWNALLQNLWDDSVWYNRLLEGNQKDFENIKHGTRIFRSIFAIRLMGVSQCYVLFLALLRNIDNLGTDPVRIFEIVEKFTFQYSVISKLPGNKVEKLYARVALDVEEAVRITSEKKRRSEIQRILSKLEQNLKDELPPWELFLESFMKISYKNSEKSRRLLKYILAEIDRYYRRTDEEAIDFSNVNIEHILPRNPQKWGLTKGEVKAYVNKLGNLTLLSKEINSRVQNKPLPEKIDFLKQSTLPITQELVKTIQDRGLKWGKDEILERQEEMARLAYEKIWNF